NLADRLWTRDNDFGSSGLANTARQQFTLVKTVLDHADYDQHIGRELAAVAGNLGLVSGWFAFDNGDHNTAAACYREAFVLAERGGDDSLVCDVLDALRQQAWTAGNMRTALQLSLRASERARHDPSARSQAQLAAREAVAHAAVGDRRECDRALAAAWRQVDRGLDDPNDPIRLHYITPDEIATTEAHAHSYLGRHEQAAANYRASLLGTDHPLRDQASYQAYYAASLARLGDTTTAYSEGLKALDLLEGPVHSPRLVNVLHPVHHIAHQSRAEEATQFTARYNHLIGSS
ncbi:MAG: hypothetical protein J2P17_24525, partial [Mycobacterium sp.]|nr:hypothetical protein [Mycobacterium sp.]